MRGLMIVGAPHLGTRVTAQFGESWYYGTVEAVRSACKQMQVAFDNGEVRWVTTCPALAPGIE